MTFWAFLDRYLQNRRAVAFSLVGAVAVLALLFWIDVIRVERQANLIAVGFGEQVRTDAALRAVVVGKWQGSVTDRELGTTQAFFDNQVTLTVNPDGKVTGTVTTKELSGAVRGVGTLEGLATENDGSLRVTYQLVTSTSASGFGTLLTKADANGKEMHGFAVYRRTNPETGDVGIGAVSLVRQ